MKVGRPKLSTEDRFHASYIVDTATGCWLWKLTLRDGYGQMLYVNGKRKIFAHRVAWMLYYGDIPINLYVLHKCDVRNCVNPEHLFLGTKADNAKDRDSKGRQPHGTRHWCAKLNEDAVREIRASPLTIGELAARFGVSDVTIGKVRNRQLWKHVV